ncbi:MAG: phosphatidylinositol mannoside acyltransferase [Streptosporangiaceae bacterium]
MTAGAQRGLSIRARLTGAAYALGWAALCRLPESWCAAAFRFVADIAWRRQGPRVGVLEGNLRRVLGPAATGKELRTVSRAAMRSYARYWLEIFRLPVVPVERLVGGMHENGQVDQMLANVATGRGVVVALPHMGNWDQAGAWIIARGGGTFTTVMERLEPESVYERFLQFRRNIGMEVLPATGGPSPFGVLAQRLRAGQMVALPCDRDVTGGGIEVDFFGEKALMMGGPAALAVQTGAALMAAALWFEGDDWGVHIHEEIPVPESGDRWQRAAVMTQALATFFEDKIREHPADWHMLQKVFAADLDPERLAAARARMAARERAAGERAARKKASAAESRDAAGP